MGDENQYRGGNNGPKFPSLPTVKSEPEALSAEQEVAIQVTKDELKAVWPEFLEHVKELYELGMIDGLRDVRVTRSSKLSRPKDVPFSVVTVRNVRHPGNKDNGYDKCTISSGDIVTIEQLGKEKLEEGWEVYKSFFVQDMQKHTMILTRLHISLDIV